MRNGKGDPGQRLSEWLGKLGGRMEDRYCRTKASYSALAASSPWSSGSIRWMQEMLRLCFRVQMMIR